MNRTEKLQSMMKTDAALITSPVNRRYYTGFAASAGTLVLTRTESVLIIDSRYYEAAKAAEELKSTEPATESATPAEAPAEEPTA